jgi:hypothetical protein
MKTNHCSNSYKSKKPKDTFVPPSPLMHHPFFFIQKKDGKLRPVQDYRQINNITISNQYPLPLITDLLTDLSSAKIFTKLDVKDGYNNICIKEGDEHKAAVQNQIQIMGTTCHVFWTEKLTSYVPKHDEL